MSNAWLVDLSRDLSYALRTWRKAPGFAAVAIATLAIGIGANTAVFSLVHTVLLASLPVDHPEQLVALSHSSLERSGGTGFPYLFFRELAAERQLLDGVLSRGGAERVTVSADAGGEAAIGELVSGSYFEVLGVKPAIGRLITSRDDVVPGAHPVVVLSHAYWQRRFGGDRAVVGRTLMVSGYPMTIVGVTARGFDGLDPGQRVDIRVPLTMQAEVRRAPLTLQRRTAWELQIVARLKRGVSLEQAQQAVSARLAEYAKNDPGITPRIVVRPAATGFGRTRGQLESALWVLMAMTAGVLAIACVNLANLFAARASMRRQELAVRTALGAGLGRLVRQLLTESVLLGLCGGALGLALAYAGAAWLARLASGNSATLLLTSRPNTAVLAFHLAIAVGSGMLFGLGPVIRLRREMAAPGLRESGRAIAGNARRHWLIGAQVALSMVVLVGAALFLQTIRALRAADLGFTPDHLLLMALDPKTAGRNDSEVIPFFHDVRERLLSIHGVTDVTFSTVRALSNSSWSAAVSINGREIQPSARALRDAVGPGYFRTLRVPLVAGRDFTAADDRSARKVAIVNESFARRFLAGANPLGTMIGAERPEYTIVGVARDTRQVHVREPPSPAWYVPYEQRLGLKHLNVIVRTTGDPERGLAEMRGAIAAVDDRVALFEVRSQVAEIDDLLRSERVLAMLGTIFAGIAAALAALGLYGLLACLVSQRRREIGLRVALGASRPAVAQAIAGSVWQCAGVGVVAGVAASLALGRYAETVLYGVTSTDSASIGAAVLAMLAIGACGSTLPVLRAMRVDPGTVLRE